MYIDDEIDDEEYDGSKIILTELPALVDRSRTKIDSRFGSACGH